MVTLLNLSPPPSFFVGDRRPEGLPYDSNQILTKQNLPGDPPGEDPYFVSLFDWNRNIPLYSAYKVTRAQASQIGSSGRPNEQWRDPPGIVLNYKLLISHLFSPQEPMAL